MPTELPDNQNCQGVHQGLISCSCWYRLNWFQKGCWRFRMMTIHSLWHLNNKGFWAFLCYILRRLLSRGQSDPTEGIRVGATDPPLPVKECLNLKSGEWVEVKSEPEILATLDDQGTYKGLRWMFTMRKFCGKRYRVYKRLERILLESNGEYREIKNTVLLENVFCDGEEFYGCDRSCFHFWREVWLKRVDDGD